MKTISVLFSLFFTLAWLYLASANTQVSISQGRWLINGGLTNRGSSAEGLLMNVRMVNATFEDKRRPNFDSKANTEELIAALPEYASHGINAITLNLQGGMPGYEGAENSAFESDGSLREGPLTRISAVIEACNKQGLAVILGFFYQRQSKVLQDDSAVRTAVVNAARWLKDRAYGNVLIEVANEYPHSGYVHALIREPEGQVELIHLVKKTSPSLLVTTSGYGDGNIHPQVAEACDFLTPHWNNTKIADIRERVKALKRFGKPIVCNEDDRAEQEAITAMRVSVTNGCSYGLMLKSINQTFPFQFHGAKDDPAYYQALKAATSPSPSPVAGETFPSDYFPPPESKGGWRRLETDDDIANIAEMDPAKLNSLREWLIHSDDRPFAAVVIRRGAIVLEVERGNSAATDARRIASCSKAICATVLAIASELSQSGLTPRRMTLADKAFDFLPWAQPLSDPRKAQITIKQLLNHTSGICPEATGARNDGRWDYILGHSGDARTERLSFDPGTACGYSTHAFAHAALVCETVAGMPYDQFAIKHLFTPLGIERWQFEFFDGEEKYGRHPSHGLGLPAREMARIAYCLLRKGQWQGQQIIPKWFVEESAGPTGEVKTPEMRWKLNPSVFSHGWELPARHDPSSGRNGEGIPTDARSKPGSGGQLIAFVPSLDLVITRQTGSSGDWAYEEYLRRACAAVKPQK